MNTFFDSFPKSEITSSNRILHTPSEFAKNTLLYVQEVGTLKSLKPHCCKREHLDSFLMLVVLSGSGVLTYGDSFYNLTSSNIALIDCKQPYSHQSNEEDPWELMWVHFNGNSAQGYFDFYQHKVNGIVLMPNNISEITSLINQLISVQSKKNFTTEIISSKLITELLALYFVTIRDTLNNSLDMSTKLEKFREYLNEHYAEKFNYELAASQFSLTSSEYDAIFEKSFGISIDDYILSRKLTHAKELLRFTMNSMEKIAAKCGFDNEKEFIEVFQNHENVTPMQYKMRW